MNKFKIFWRFATLMFSASCFQLNAQSTLNTASNSAIINGVHFDYSIGEMTLVSTDRNENLIITQGFLQPQSIPASDGAQIVQSGINDLANQIKVYPNPTQNLLFIEPSEMLDNQFDFQLLDINGKVIVRKNDQQLISANKYTLDLSSFAAGNYFLLIQTNKVKMGDPISFKIQKLH
ncbi:MAG TPA: T9SS type A sorting domain-containing protein [Chitinophagaceae bacterium]|nr:T9SS type A sorting domain-containing protein [Chitinophagaceae bacterium]